MDLQLLLLLLLGLAGQGSVVSRPELLQVQTGSSILVQCHYRLQDVKAQKVWCRFSAASCQPLVTSAVDRRGPGGGRTFLTDLGGGLLQVEMVSLQEEDAGEYGCMVEGAAGPQTLHRISLVVLPQVAGQSEETYKLGSVAEDPTAHLPGSASPWEPRQHEKSFPLIGGAVFLLGVLVVAVVLFAVMAKRKATRHSVCGSFQSCNASGTDPSSAVPHISDCGLAVVEPSDVPYTRLHSPISFDSAAYRELALDVPSPGPPLPPKVHVSSKSVTYAAVIFPKGDKGEVASCEPPQDPPDCQTPPS
ncbi:trem-like transcript 1 protein isoform X1 [Ochotona curzoniae]|uniref:trem-like transcript 1 protein isoform X1 n=1 Tax=Ochotona curzoniae TaxID=130825 RepID=UPI001B3530D3|nr:trem-like transcript 1 protein isoform X1 [Ochotona curzoniae]